MSGNRDLNFTIRANAEELERVLKRISHVTGNSLSMAIESALKKSQETINLHTQSKYKFDPNLGMYTGTLGATPLSTSDYYAQKEALKDLKYKRDILLAKKSELDYKRAVADIRSHFLETAGTVALLGKLFTKPIQDAMQYEKSLTNVAKVYNLNKQQTDQFGKALLNLAKIMPVPVENLGDLAYQMSQLGIAQKDLMPALELAVKAGMGLDIPLPEVGTKIGRLKSAFGLSIEGLKDVLDFVNEASNRVAATPGEILNAVTRIAPLSSTLGITAQETTGLASVLLGIGLQPEAVETGIKDLIGNLDSIFTSRVGDSERYASIQKLRLDRSKFEEALRTDKFHALSMFFQAGEKAKARGENLDQILLKIFGQNHYTKILALFNKEGLAKRREFLAMANDPKSYLGSLEQEYARVSQTGSALMQIMKNNIKAFSVTIGDYLLPKIKTVFLWLSKISGWATKMAEEYPSLVKFGILAAAWAGGIVILNGTLRVTLGILGLMKTLLLFGKGKYGWFTPILIGIEILPRMIEIAASKLGISSRTLTSILGALAGGAYGFTKGGLIGAGIGVVGGAAAGYAAGAIGEGVLSATKDVEDYVKKAVGLDNPESVAEAQKKIEETHGVKFGADKPAGQETAPSTIKNTTYNDNRVITLNIQNAQKEALDRFKEEAVQPAWRKDEKDE